MLTNETISKLNEMHLGTMAAGFTAQLTDPQFQSLSFEERFSILVDAEWSARKSNRLAKLIKKAGYSAPGASIEDISFLPEWKLDQAQIRGWLPAPISAKHRTSLFWVLPARARLI